MNKTILKFIVLSAIFTLALSVNYLFAAWTGPTAPPPGGNTPTPVNVGDTFQNKAGSFTFNAGGTRYDTYLATLGGRVGIGTTDTSSATLSVAGTIKSITQSNYYRIPLTDLTAEHSGCTIDNLRDLSSSWRWLQCNSACNRWCRDQQGYSGGTFVEWHNVDETGSCACIP